MIKPSITGNELRSNELVRWSIKVKNVSPRLIHQSILARTFSQTVLHVLWFCQRYYQLSPDAHQRSSLTRGPGLEGKDDRKRSSQDINGSLISSSEDVKYCQTSTQDRPHRPRQLTWASLIRSTRT